jgi:hypothetical protein
LCLVSTARAQIVIDFTFDHLNGVAPGGVPSDAVRAEDKSGNRYHGFYGGGAGATPARLDGVTPGQITPSGTPGLDFSNNSTGTVILRQNLTAGTNNFTFGAGNTPSPYFTIGATDSWTIEGVVNFQNAGDDEVIIANNFSSVAVGEWWWRTENAAGVRGLQFRFDDGPDATSDIHLTDAILDNLWHHVAVVFDRDPNGDGVNGADGQVRTYVDQVLIGTTNFNPSLLGVIGDGTRDIEIGHFDAATPNFDGFMDRIVISRSALGPGSFVAAVPEPVSILLWVAVAAVSIGGMSLRQRQQSHR